MNFRRTLFACYRGYITGAIVNNIAPLLFIVFQREYSISFEMLGRLVLFNFGTQVIDWSNAATKPGEGHARATLMLLVRHATELLDGVAILVRASAIQASQPLVRGLFETFLAVEYIASADTENRALAYQTAYAHARIALYERLDEATLPGKQLRGTLTKDKDVPNFDIDRIGFDATSAKKNLDNLLAEPEFAPIEQEWQNIRAGGRRGAIPWFSFFGGPRNLEELAGQLGHIAMYEFLYRSYSGTVHAENVMRFAVPDANGKAAMLGLRHPLEAQRLCSLAVSIILKMYRMVIRTLASDKEDDFAVWYVTDIRRPYLKMLGGPLIIPR
jgi:hypothetical protein